MNGYDLSRKFWDYSFENPEKVKVYHVAIYFFAIEHCNRLGWKSKFGFPTSMVLDAIGLRSYSSYKKYFDELVDWGFFKVHEYSKNQYSSNIIELSLDVKARGKALDKATIKHGSKQGQSTGQGKDSIDKPLTNKPINQETNAQARPSFYSRKLFSDEKRNQLFAQWLKVMSEKGKVYTETQLEILSRKLMSYDIRDSVKMIENATENGWKSFFPIDTTARNVDEKQGKVIPLQKYDMPPQIKKAMSEMEAKMNVNKTKTS